MVGVGEDGGDWKGEGASSLLCGAELWFIGRPKVGARWREVTKSASGRRDCAVRRREAWAMRGFTSFVHLVSSDTGLEVRLVHCYDPGQLCWRKEADR